MISPRRLLFLMMPLALLATGCATTSSLKIPVRPSPNHTLASPPPARFRIPVVIVLPKFSEVEKHLADAMKEDFEKKERSLAKSLGATVWWDPMTWEFNGNSLTAHVHLHAKNLPGGPKGSATASNPETIEQQLEKDMKVDISSAVSWTKDFHLEAPDFGEGDTANASVTEEDGKKAERLVRKGTSKFHESLRQRTNDVLAKAKEMWVKFQEPMKMGQDVWLQIQPILMSVSACRLVPDPAGVRLETDFEFIGQPNVTIGDKPHYTITEMPPLKPYNESVPPGFHIERNLQISFKEVNKILVDPKTGILNKTLPGSGDHNLKVDQLDVYGSGGQLVVEAQIEYQPVLNLSSQPAKLTIYLVGTPVYHEDQQLIDFPDMDFDIQTSDFLVQMAEFVMGSGMREQLRKEAKIPVGTYLDKAKEEMTKLLNRPLGSHAKLKTTITTLKMEEAFITDNGLEGRIALDGDATVDVDW